jgi:hypothetical protein
MVKSVMLVLTGREKTDADGLYPKNCSLLLKTKWIRGGEKTNII